MTLLTQPNEYPYVDMTIIHRLDLPSCCPYSHNPQPASFIVISYHAESVTLEVYALKAYIDTFIEGKGDVRSMESMIQTIAQDCANTLRVRVRVRADVQLQREDSMVIRCTAYAK